MTTSRRLHRRIWYRAALSAALAGAATAAPSAARAGEPGPGAPAAATADATLSAAATAANTPSAPRNVTATASGHSRINLDWDLPASHGGATVTGYRIWVSEDRRRTWRVLANVSGLFKTSYAHTGLAGRTTRHYQVAAVNRFGAGTQSSVVWATTDPALPGAPTGLSAAPAGTSRINLSWTAPTNTGGVPLHGYKIEVAEGAAGQWRVLLEKSRPNATTYAHINLSAGTTYRYRVSAINQVGVGPASQEARATTQSSVPGRPTSLTARADGTTRIALAWEVPESDGGSRIRGYRIEVSENGGFVWSDLVANTFSTNRTYVHTNLAPATTRHYRVSAINSEGTGDPSAVAVGTTNADLPGAPTGLVANAVDATRIDLVWVAPTYDGGAAITGYRIEVSADGAAWIDLVRNSGSTATTRSHTGIDPGSTRYYRVSAINSAGTGQPSEVANATTDDAAARTGRLNGRILPRAAAAIASSTVAAIASRVEAVASRAGDRTQVTTGGADMPLDGASFVLPLGSQGAQQVEGLRSSLATWGGGEYVGLGEPGAKGVDWSGNLTNWHVGADVRVRPDILAGVAGTSSSGAFDFTDRTHDRPVAGTYNTRLTSLNPYVAWLMDDPGSVIWASAGYGWGNIEIADDLAALRSTSARMTTGAAGGGRTLLTTAAGNVRVRGEGLLARVNVNQGAEFDSLTVDMRRVRLLLEWTQQYRSDAGDEIAFLLEGGMRYDGGSGAQGTGIEVGSGMRFVSATLGMRIEGRGRALLTGEEGYQEWGLGALLQIDPEYKGEGLSIRIAPTWGEATGGPQELWERGVADVRSDGAELLGGRLDAEVAYGLRGFAGTPYGGLLLADRGARAYSGGLRYDLAGGLGVRLEATRREAAFGPPQHTIGVRGGVRF